mmetsp:Transcript_16366/g.38899  ORF Transcript_16366/g.38899 Transcript_16366/m.38899 type:complete len:422 (+) Transcript_16366:166-1431(+)
MIQRSARTKLLFLVLLWYVVSFLGIILNKTILSPGSNHVDVTLFALVQMLITVVFGKLRQVLRRQSPSGGAWGFPKLRRLMLLGLLRSMVTVLGLVSLRFVAASFTETVKASSPLFTVAAAWLLMGQRTELRVVLTLLPIILGLVIATAGEHSFTWVGFLAALAVNVTECVQNVFCSWLLQDGPKGFVRFSASELQYYSALAALPILFAVFCTGSMNVPAEAHTWLALSAASFVFFLQSALAFKIMSLCSAVTMSVMNTTKRAIIICLSALYFGNVITLTTLFGTVITLSGSSVYSLLTSGKTEDASSSGKASGKDSSRAALGTRKAQPSASCLAGRCRLRSQPPGLRRTKLACAVLFPLLFRISKEIGLQGPYCPVVGAVLADMGCKRSGRQDFAEPSFISAVHVRPRRHGGLLRHPCTG